MMKKGLLISIILISINFVIAFQAGCTYCEPTFWNLDSLQGATPDYTLSPNGDLVDPSGQTRLSASHQAGAFPQVSLSPQGTTYGGGPAGGLTAPPGAFPQGGGGGDPGSYLLSVFPAISGFLQNFAVLAPEDQTGDGAPAVSSSPFADGSQPVDTGTGARELEVLANGNIGRLRGQTVNLEGTNQERVESTNSQEGFASIDFNDGLADTTQLNAATTYYQNNEPIISIQTPKDIATNIVVNPLTSNGVLTGLSFPLADIIINHLSRTFVSAQQGTGQHMHLNGNDIDKSGNNIRTIPHIDLDNYNAGGQELVLEVGIKTRVHNQRIDAAPLLENLDIDVNKLSNKLAPQDSFIVASDPNSKGFIRSEDGTFFHTDRTSNPGASAGDYARLIINTERLEMFS